MTWNPFLPGLAKEDYERQARQRDAAEELLIAAVADGTYTEIDGAQSPTTTKIRELLGLDRQLEMNSNWALTSQQWRCPCCNRDKSDISRVARTGRIVCKLVVHHDHMKEALKQSFQEEFIRANGHEPSQDGYDLVTRMGGAWAAHADVLVCEDCNNADAKGKRLVNAPRYFSFAPNLIRRP